MDDDAENNEQGQESGAARATSFENLDMNSDQERVEESKEFPKAAWGGEEEEEGVQENETEGVRDDVDPTQSSKNWLDKEGDYIKPENDGPMKVKFKWRTVRYRGVARSWSEALELAKKRREHLLPPCRKGEDGRKKILQTSLDRIGRKVSGLLGLYFRTLRLQAILFLIVCLLHLPLIVFGIALEQKRNTFESTGVATLAQTTLGALLVEDYTLFGLSRVTIIRIASFLDVGAMLILILGGALARESQQKVFADFQERVLTLSDYTVMVEGLPSEHATPEYASEVAEHFESYPTLEGKQRRDVARVCFGTTCGYLINLFGKRGNLRTLRRRYAALENATKGEQGERLHRWYTRREQDVTDNIIREWASIADEYRTTVAFVTFETADEVALCCSDYPSRKYPGWTWTVPRTRLFRGAGAEKWSPNAGENGERPSSWGHGFALRVTQAPEPGNVVWENLEHTVASRCRALTLIGVAVGLLLLLSFGLLVGSAVVDNQLVPAVDVKESRTQGSLNCTRTFSLDPTGDLDEMPVSALDAVDKVRFDPFDGSVCRDFTETAIFDGDCDLTRDDGVDALKAEDVCRCEASFCYQAVCNNVGFLDFQEDISIGADGSVSSQSFCSDFFSALTKRALLLAASAIVAVIVNLGMRSVVGKLAEKEQHKTTEGVLKSAANKISVAQVINMLVTPIVAFGSIPGHNDGLLGFRTLFGGEHSDVDMSMYEGGGINMLLTILLQAVGASVAELIFTWLIAAVRKKRRMKCVLQDDLDQVYKPRNFKTAERYGILKALMFVSVTVSGGFPLASYGIFFYTFVSFFTDKYVVLTDCYPPVSASPAIDTGVWKDLLGGVWLHSILSFFMYNEGSDESALVFDGNSILERIFRPVALPHAVVFFLLTVYFLLSPFMSSLRQLFAGCFGTQVYASDIPTFSAAVTRRGRIGRQSTVAGAGSQEESLYPWRGPTTYSMLEDSRYEHIFKIKPSEIAVNKMKELKRMQPALERHDEEGFTVFDNREKFSFCA